MTPSSCAHIAGRFTCIATSMLAHQHRLFGGHAGEPVGGVVRDGRAHLPGKAAGFAKQRPFPCGVCWCCSTHIRPQVRRLQTAEPRRSSTTLSNPASAADTMADRGGFGRGFGDRGRGDRGRGRGDRGRGRGGRRGRKDEEEKWVPCTKLGRLVQQVGLDPSQQRRLFLVCRRQWQQLSWNTAVQPTMRWV